MIVATRLLRLSLPAVALVASACAPTAESVKGEIDKVLNKLPELLRLDPTGESAVRFLNQEQLPGKVIQPYFYGAPGAPHENSSERTKRVAEVEDALLAHEPALLDLLKRRGLSRDDETSGGLGSVRNLMFFVKPTESLRQCLLGIIDSKEADERTIPDAYTLLFKLRLDDAALRERVVRESLASLENSEHRLGRTIMADAASQWCAFPEMLAVYRALLSAPFPQGDFSKSGRKQRLYGNYGIAAEGLSRFGVLAADFVDLCQSRLSELDPTDEYQKNGIADLNECIEILQGRRVPELTLDWKSHFLGVSEEAYHRYQKSSAGETTPAKR